MKQKIIGFGNDDIGDWRAALECRHFQHLRHDPPLTVRPWILDETERLKRIGIELECKKCEERKPSDF